MDHNEEDDLRQVHYPKFRHSRDRSPFSSTSTFDPAPEVGAADHDANDLSSEQRRIDPTTDSLREATEPSGVGLKSKITESAAMQSGGTNKGQTSREINHQINTSVASSKTADDREKQKISTPGAFANSTTNRGQLKLAKLAIYTSRNGGSQSRREAAGQSNPDTNVMDGQKPAKLDASTGSKLEITANRVIDASTPSEVSIRRDQQLARPAATTRRQPRGGISTYIEIGDPGGMAPADEKSSSLELVGNQLEIDPADSLGVTVESRTEIENPGRPVAIRDPVVGNLLDQDPDDNLGAAVESRTQNENPDRPVARGPLALAGSNSGLAVAHLVWEDSVHHLPLGTLESQDVADTKEEGRLARQQKTQKYLVCFAATGLLIVAAIVLGAILGRDRNKSMVTVTIPPTLNMTQQKHPEPLARQNRIYSLLPAVTTNVIEANPASSQAQAWDWLEGDLLLNNYSDWRALQRFSLVVFFYATDGDNWVNKDRYEHHECDWYSWDVQELGMVSSLGGISLFANPNFGGKIPSEYGNFRQLRYALLRDSALTGTIPPELGQWSTLTMLNLANNELAGTIPSQLGCLGEVKNFVLESNRLTGTVPAELGNLSNVNWLHLSTNFLTGPLPSELGSLTSLIGSSLNQNQLTGTIPKELTGLVNNNHGSSSSSSLLETLNLTNNFLSGTVPQELCSLTRFSFDCSKQLCGCNCPCQ